MYKFKNNIDNQMKQLINECIKMCREIDIPISNNITFGLDSAECRHGQCTWHRSSDLCDITISKYLVKPEDMMNTIIHELLHSCADGHSHGYAWQRYAYRIYQAYNIEITRCSNKEHVKIDVAKSRKQYFSREDFEANRDLLVAIGRVDRPEPIWYVKKTAKLVQNLSHYTSDGKKLEIKNI